MSHDHDDHTPFDGVSEDQLTKDFPHVASEIPDTGASLRTILDTLEDGDEEEIEADIFQGYDPSILDYLARANTHHECLEIIEYCLRKNEIDDQEARELVRRLKDHGPSIFGTRKPGFYDSFIHRRDESSVE